MPAVHHYHLLVPDPTVSPTEAPIAPTEPAVTSSTLIGPNGTAPGMSFIEQQERPVIDAQTGRAAGAPLAIAALLLLVIFTTVLLRAARAKRRSTSR
jgi:hypothetical protein